MRRAVISLPSNIAEGAAWNHNKEFKQFCYISLGSLAELDTHLILVDKLNVAKIPDKVQEELGEIRRMLIGLISFLEKTK